MSSSAHKQTPSQSHFSLVAVPLSMVVVFCISLALVSTYQADQSTTTTAKNAPREKANDRTTELPALNIAPQLSLPSIEPQVIESPASAVTEATAPTAPIDGTTTLQPSSTPGAASSNIRTSPPVKLTNNAALQQIMNQKINVPKQSKR